jgi:hypothetical protein
MFFQHLTDQDAGGCALNMRPLTIYLCDLTHDTIVLVSDTIPINIGYIGAYARSIYGTDIQVSLFKYTSTAVDAIKQSPPDILALSNYSWNSNLSERVAGLAKQLSLNTITVQGGTNFPHEAELQLEFLKTRPSIDTHTELEAEVAFANLVGRVLDARDGGTPVFSAPIDGCVFIDPQSRDSSDEILIKGELPARIRDLAVVPSPYLDGSLDKFFDGRLTPFMETNRGCPFQCSFCHTGNDYFQKTNVYPMERTLEEIAYIAPRASELGIVNLLIADTNFGMYPRDRQITEALYEAREEYSWPLQIMATTGKNNKERVIAITDILGPTFPVNMAVQSMDDKVLKTIRRSNIKLEDYTLVNEHLKERGRSGNAEMILGLPGETRESFIEGVAKVIEAGVSKATIYTLMLLNGTEFKNPEYRARHRIVGKYRIVPLNFSKIDDELVFDYEEVGIQTKDMSFDDYLYLRGFSLMVEALHNDRVFEEMFRFALSQGVRRPEMLQRVYDSIEAGPPEVRQILNGFMDETRSELWDDEDELLEHYAEPANLKHLIDGEIGGNLIYKYKSMSITSAANAWIEFLAKLCHEIAADRSQSPSEIEIASREIQMLSEFCQNKLDGLLTATGDAAVLEMVSTFDVAGWLNGEEGVTLSAFAVEKPIRYEFFYTPDQLKQQLDARKRWGSDINALSKIVTRVSNVGSLIRKVRTEEGEQIVYTESERDRFTRYSLSN